MESVIFPKTGVWALLSSYSALRINGVFVAYTEASVKLVYILKTFLVWRLLLEMHGFLTAHHEQILGIWKFCWSESWVRPTLPSSKNIAQGERPFHSFIQHLFIDTSLVPSFLLGQEIQGWDLFLSSRSHSQVLETRWVRGCCLLNED